ncbi:MAG TPA: hypothetical protein VHT23_10395 [Gemmatimonadaceae bacterium]|jgi:hypothetical protein|nr:hypothetical protein [Gemmatimonadaceae bacterium]
MSMLHLLPWCNLTKPYNIGDLRLVPLVSGKQLAVVSTEVERSIRQLASAYRSLDGMPVSRCAMAYFEGDPMRELAPDEIRESSELIQLACFASLAARRFFRDTYSNSTCFTRYVQRFQDTRSIAVQTRRRDGYSLDGRVLPQTVFGIPPHAASVREVKIDDTLLAALVAHRREAKAGEWARYENAIDLFNFANSDDENVPFHVEWVMLAAAFQRLTGAASDADAVATAFEAVVVPENPRFVRDVRFRRTSATAANRSLRSAWMREFYSLRGEYAHGRIATNRPHLWEPIERLLLSAIAFPLLAKQMLAKSSRYGFTDDDWSQVDAFEALLDSDFMREPSDQAHGSDWIWTRLQSDVHGARRLRRFIKERLKMRV